MEIKKLLEEKKQQVMQALKGAVALQLKSAPQATDETPARQVVRNKWVEQAQRRRQELEKRAAG